MLNTNKARTVDIVWIFPTVEYKLAHILLRCDKTEPLQRNLGFEANLHYEKILHLNYSAIEPSVWEPHSTLWWSQKRRGLLGWRKLWLKSWERTWRTGLVIFSCPRQLNRWPCHSLNHSVSDTPFDFRVLQSCGRQWQWQWQWQWLQWLRLLQRDSNLDFDWERFSDLLT